MKESGTETGVIDRIGIGEGFQFPQAPEAFEDGFGIGRYRDGVGLGFAVGRAAGFELATEDESGRLGFLDSRLGSSAKKISASRRPVSSMRPIPSRNE